MSFVSFLKKVGLGIIKYVPPLLTGAQLVSQVDPKIAPIVDRLSAIFSAGQQIEHDFANAFPGQQTGPQKLLALTSQVGDLLKQTELATGMEIADEALLQKAATEIAQGVVDAMNAFKGKDGSAVSGTLVLQGVGTIR